MPSDEGILCPGLPHRCAVDLGDGLPFRASAPEEPVVPSQAWGELANIDDPSETFLVATAIGEHFNIGVLLLCVCCPGGGYRVCDAHGFKETVVWGGVQPSHPGPTACLVNLKSWSILVLDCKANFTTWHG